MVAEGDILEFRLRSRYGAGLTQNLNVFQFFVSALTGTPLLELMDAEMILDWWTNVKPFIAAVTSTGIFYTGVDVFNLSNPIEFGGMDFVPPDTGGVAGEILPPYASWGFLYKRRNTTTRNGYKRFAGVPESLQADGIATVAAVTSLEALAAALYDNYVLAGSAGGAWTFTISPAIVRKTPLGVLSIYQEAKDVVYRSIGTQNTRKFGRGA